MPDSLPFKRRRKVKWDLGHSLEMVFNAFYLLREKVTDKERMMTKTNGIAEWK